MSPGNIDASTPTITKSQHDQKSLRTSHSRRTEPSAEEPGGAILVDDKADDPRSHWQFTFIGARIRSVQLPTNRHWPGSRLSEW